MAKLSISYDADNVYKINVVSKNHNILKPIINVY